MGGIDHRLYKKTMKCSVLDFTIDGREEVSVSVSVCVCVYVSVVLCHCDI